MSGACFEGAEAIHASSTHPALPDRAAQRVRTDTQLLWCRSARATLLLGVGGRRDERVGRHEVGRGGPAGGGRVKHLRVGVGHWAWAGSRVGVRVMVGAGLGMQIWMF